MSANDTSRAGSRALKMFIFFYFSTIGLFLPYLPLLFRSKGLSDWQVGILFSVGPLVTIAVQPFWGFISDRFKTVKKMIMLQLSVTVVLSFFVFRINQFELLIPALFVFNVFAFPIIPLMDSLSLSSARSTNGHYGAFRLWGSLGFALSALFFGFLFRRLDLELFPVCYSALLLLCLILSFFLVDAVYVGKKAGLKDVRHMLSNKGIITFLLLTALLSSTNRANDAFLGIFIKQLGGHSDTVGYAWTVAALSEVPVLAMGGVLVARFGELRLLTAAAAIFAVRWALFHFISNPNAIIFIQLTHSLSFGLFFLCSVSYMSKLVPDRLRSSGQGLLAAFIGGIAGIAGSTLGGAIMSGMGPRTMYLICSVTALLAFLFYLHRYRLESRENASQLN